MSFLSVLKTIGKVAGTIVGIGTSPTIAPVIGAIPVAGPIIETILNSIFAVEGLVTAAGAGAAKKTAVTAVVTAQHPTIDQATLSTMIDQIVAAMNGLSVVLASASAAPAK